MSSQGVSLSVLPPIKSKANSTQFGISRLSPVQRKPPPFFLRVALPGVGEQGGAAWRMGAPGAHSPPGKSSTGRSKARPACGPRPRRRHQHPTWRRRPEGRAPSPRRRTNTPPPPPRHRPRGALTPSRPSPGSGEEAGPGGGVVASPPGSAQADAWLVYRPQAPGLAATAAAQARAGRPPSAHASRLPGAAAGGQVPGRPRRRRRRRPGRGRERGHHGCGRPGQAGEGADEGRSRAASGPQLSAPSRLRSSRRWNRRRTAGPGGEGGRAKDSLLSRPTCLEPPHPPSPTTRS